MLFTTAVSARVVITRRSTVKILMLLKYPLRRLQVERLQIKEKKIRKNIKKIQNSYAKYQLLLFLFLYKQNKNKE